MRYACVTDNKSCECIFLDWQYRGQKKGKIIKYIYIKILKIYFLKDRGKCQKYIENSKKKKKIENSNAISHLFATIF